MFHQNSNGNPDRVHQWGCYAVAACGATVAVTGNPMKRKTFLTVVEVLEAQGSLIEDPYKPGTFMYVKDPVNMFHHLGLEVEFVGKKGADYECQPDEFELLLWRRLANGQWIYHFTYGDGIGKTVYDPWGPFSMTAKYGELRSKRVFRIKTW